MWPVESQDVSKYFYASFMGGEVCSTWICIGTKVKMTKQQTEKEEMDREKDSELVSTHIVNVVQSSVWQGCPLL